MKRIMGMTMVMFLLALAFTAFAAPAGATQDKVGVCHRTAAEGNRYVYIEVPADEANGHITGTDKQHNQQVNWPEDGTWRGVPHQAGDPVLDYLADSAEECNDTTPPPPPTCESDPSPELCEQPETTVEEFVDKTCEAVMTTTVTTEYVWNEELGAYVPELSEVVTTADTGADCSNTPPPPPPPGDNPDEPVTLPATGAGDHLGLLAFAGGLSLLAGATLMLRRKRADVSE